jgi:isoamylase
MGAADAGFTAFRVNFLTAHDGFLLATLLLSQSTPMLLAGDEFARTQRGDNNAYCQDNEISWLNWDVRRKGKAMVRFVQKLTRMRHSYPILRRSRFLTGGYDEELFELTL